MAVCVNVRAQNYSFCFIRIRGKTPKHIEIVNAYLERAALHEERTMSRIFGLGDALGLEVSVVSGVPLEGSGGDDDDLLAVEVLHAASFEGSLEACGMFRLGEVQEGVTEVSILVSVDREIQEVVAVLEVVLLELGHEHGLIVLVRDVTKHHGGDVVLDPIALEGGVSGDRGGAGRSDGRGRVSIARNAVHHLGDGAVLQTFENCKNASNACGKMKI